MSKSRLHEQAEYWELQARIIRGVAERELVRAAQYAKFAAEYRVRIKEEEALAKARKA